ncbi:dihydrofolate reductase family protein [Nakamurella lactea]|uniref:dihydrofolate reductase family protein n=1 Tax=Nakamurella lactea TaxID=459515 RepID=UPI00041D9E56|nr:dihydrofolate reductase family protein [Nakamurella lactea]
MQIFRPGSVTAGHLSTISLTDAGTFTTDAEDLLAAAMAWPSLEPDPNANPDAVDNRPPWTLRANMIGSLDGGATIDGRSAGMGTLIDQKLMGLQRDLADVVLVGAGTVIAENYPGAKVYPRRAARRRRWGRSELPRWAIVASRPLPADLPAIVDSAEPPFVITADGVDQPAGTEVISTGSSVDVGAALPLLADRGQRRILCEGGPTLLGQLAVGDHVDELSLTIAPTLLGTGSTTPMLGGVDLLAQRAADGGADRWRLVTLLADGDHLFTRYRRER